MGPDPQVRGVPGPPSPQVRAVPEPATNPGPKPDLQPNPQASVEVRPDRTATPPADPARTGEGTGPGDRDPGTRIARPVGLGRLELQEHRRSFESRRRGQPRPQRPISMRLTIVPRLDPSARHHGRGPLPPLGPTRRRRGLSLRPRRDPSPPEASCVARARPRAGAASAPRFGNWFGGEPAAHEGIRARGRMSPPWAQQSLPSTPPRTPQAGPSKPRPLAGSPRLGSSAFRTSPRHPRSPPSGWTAPPQRRGPRPASGGEPNAATRGPCPGSGDPHPAPREPRPAPGEPLESDPESGGGSRAATC